MSLDSDQWRCIHGHTKDEHRVCYENAKALENNKTLDKHIEKKLGVPVLDGVVCALIIATGLVKYSTSTSKIRRYNPEY